MRREFSDRNAYGLVKMPFFAFKINDTTQKETIHQVTTMLVTSKYVLFPGHSHLLTTSTDANHF